MTDCFFHKMSFKKIAAFNCTRIFSFIEIYNWVKTTGQLSYFDFFTKRFSLNSSLHHHCNKYQMIFASISALTVDSNPLIAYGHHIDFLYIFYSLNDVWIAFWVCQNWFRSSAWNEVFNIIIWRFLYLCFWIHIVYWFVTFGFQYLKCIRSVFHYFVSALH